MGIKDILHECEFCKEKFGFRGYSRRNRFCSLECSRSSNIRDSEEIRDRQYQEWIDGKELEYKNSRPLIRRFLTIRDGYKCACCSITEYNSKPITLWVDHIDGNAANNHHTNFRLICPNCDSQSPTFGGKNRGSGRKARGLPQYG
jgi:5-methylcytosine-specific restriction endonuclease McrA